MRKPEGSRYPDSPEGFRGFTRKMPREDRIFFAVDGRIPDAFLEFVWSGIMAMILPESLQFTEEETCRYLRTSGSRRQRQGSVPYDRRLAGMRGDAGAAVLTA